MSEDKMIEILMSDKRTKYAAEKFLEGGTILIEEEWIKSFLEEYLISPDDIDNGKIENFTSIIYEGQKYYIRNVI